MGMGGAGYVKRLRSERVFAKCATGTPPPVTTATKNVNEVVTGIVHAASTKSELGRPTPRRRVLVGEHIRGNCQPSAQHSTGAT